MFHSGGLSAPTPPNLPPGHSSPQASYTVQGYSLPGHQPLPHGFPSIGQLTQVRDNLFTIRHELMKAKTSLCFYWFWVLVSILIRLDFLHPQKHQSFHRLLTSTRVHVDSVDPEQPVWTVHCCLDMSPVWT